MAISTPIFGTVVYSSTSTIAPSYPSGISAGDAVYLFVALKGSSPQNFSIASPPSGFSLVYASGYAGGYGTTLGVDTGNTRYYLYKKNTVTGSETGSVSVTITNFNASWATLWAVPLSGGALTATLYGTGLNVTPPLNVTLTLTPVSGATPTTVNQREADWYIFGMVVPTDGYSSLGLFTGPFCAVEPPPAGLPDYTSYNFGAYVPEIASAVGNDIGGFLGYTGNLQPAVNPYYTGDLKFTAQANGTRTNIRGPVFALHLSQGITGTFAASEGNDTFAATGTVVNTNVTGTMSAVEPTKDSFAATGTVLVQGSLAATESNDTFAATGKVLVQGTLAATETGDDTFAAAGSVYTGPVTGTMAATETGADTFASTGQVIVQGDLAATETGADTFVASGQVIVQGDLAATETGDDTFAATGDVIVQGSLAATETGDDTFAASGQVIVSGSLAAAETGDDTFAASGQVIVQGDLAATETGDDTFAASGQVIVQGDLAATETGDDTFAATGVIPVAGTMAANETGDDTFAATGIVFYPGITGTMAAVESDDTFAATGAVIVQGSLAAVETGNDTFAATGVTITQGDLAATETGVDAFAATGSVITQGDLAATETGDDTFAATGVVPVAGTMAAVEVTTDTFSATGQVIVQGTLAATEAADVFAATGRVIVQGTLAAIEADDVFAATGRVIVQGDLAATETGDDTFAATGFVVDPPVYGTMAATEAPDSFFATGLIDALFTITVPQAQLLRDIYLLNGLASEPLVVMQNKRVAGQLEQTIDESGGNVTITTTATTTQFSGDVGTMIEELAALYGLTDPVLVTPTSRISGGVVQAFTTSGTTTTVTRQ